MNEDAIVTTTEEIVENVEQTAPVETPAEPTPVVEGATPTTEEVAVAEGEEKKKRAPRVQPNYDAQFAKLKEMKEKDEQFEVVAVERVRGGLRCAFDGMPIFLPSSHFSLRRNPAEEEFDKLIGQKLMVKVQELQEEETRKTAIITRRPMMMDEFWGKINVGDIVEGAISSVSTFGVFVDLGGMEGLIHISRLSHAHIDDPTKHYEKGAMIRCIVTELNRETNRIALSAKELENSPWKEIEKEFAIDSVHEGVVRRMVDFGAFVELKAGVDGLLRNTELSYTKRISHPNEVLKIDDKVNVKIIAVSEEKRTVTLSLKQTEPNPWQDLFVKYPIGTCVNSVVTQVLNQGAIMRLNDEVDGFMPRSKMRNLGRGKKIPFNIGDNIEIIVADINPTEESLILALKSDDIIPKEEEEIVMNNRDRAPKQAAGDVAVSLGDLLSEASKKTLETSAE